MRRSVFLCVFIAALFILSAPSDSFAKREASGSGSLQELPPLKGPKKTIAVMDFENKAGAEAEWNLGSGMAEMLATARHERPVHRGPLRCQ